MTEIVLIFLGLCLGTVPVLWFMVFLNLDR